MANCEHCQTFLFEYLYGLLDDKDHQEVFQHVNACPSCQASLEKARAQQSLLAHAARAIPVVPEFALPSVAPVTLPLASSSPAETPAAPPAASAPTPRRQVWRRPVFAWSAAAAILVAIAACASLYRGKVHAYDRELADQHREYRQVEQQLAALPAKYQAQQALVLDGLRAHEITHLQVVGPARVEPGARANLQITTRHADGNLVPSQVTVKLLEDGVPGVLQETQVNSVGQARVEIDAGKARPNRKLQVLVEANTPVGRASLRENIYVPAPSYVTRIDTNKIAYQIKDVLFFRVLLLDRLRLTPPSQPILMRVALRNPANDVVKELLMWSGDGGVLAGVFAIEENFLAGPYVLHAAPFDGPAGSHAFLCASTVGLAGSPCGTGALLATCALIPGRSVLSHVQPAALSFEVLRHPLAPGMQFDKDRYLPGDVFSAVLPRGVPASAKLTIDNQPVPATIESASGGSRGSPRIIPGAGIAGASSVGKSEKSMGKPIPAAMASPQGRITARIPEKVPAGASNLPLTLQWRNGTRQEELRGAVPLQPTAYTVDFFPEGGDLIAKVPNRVFYRVRTVGGDPVTGSGHVILLSNKNEIVDSPYQVGLGFLDFTPEVKESYTVRITSPGSTNEVARPFASLGGVRTSGVVLHVPTAVGKAGEPIRVTLRNQAPPRKLLLLAQCRGQVVDQRWVDAGTGSRDVTLETTPEARGMVRVTVYELQDGALEPLAERLVYRAPAKELRLGVALSTQQRQPGQPLQATIRSRDEKGKPAPAWVLASVVDERFQPRPPSLSAYFYLLNEIHAGANFDDAQVMLNDSPESVEMLERFLGTHGWRRFVPTSPLQVAAKEPGPAIAAHQRSAAPAIFSQENMPLDAVRKKDQEMRTALLTPLHLDAFGEQNALQAKLNHWAAVINDTVRDRALFEGRVEQVIRLGLGLLLFFLLGLSLILMSVGLYRIVRRHQTATPAFGGAFACLAVCLLMMLVGNVLGPVPDARFPARDQASAVTHENGGELLDALAKNVAPQRGHDAPPAGEFAMRANKQDDGGFAAADSGNRGKGTAQKDAKPESEMRKAETFAIRDRREGLPQPSAHAVPNVAMNKHFEAARSQPAAASPGPLGGGMGSGGIGAGAMRPLAKPAVTATVAPPPASPLATMKETVKKKAEAKLLDESSAREREYAHQHQPNLAADTLLWSPALFLTNGSAEVRFDIANGQATYRLLLLGHSPTGRLGFAEMRLDVP